jgi:quercetin dioxygenase-like cupin family protein
MNSSDFAKSVVLEGYAEPVSITREANGFVDTHTHPFAAKALITQGSLKLRVGTIDTSYEVGDIFQLDVEVPHKEYYGPNGVTYLVGRKQA